MLNFYKTNDFRLFKCSLDKSPAVPKKTDWRDSRNHLDLDSVERIMDSGGFIGAWLPKNYVIIDIDIKGDSHKHDGIEPFKELCLKHNIEDDLLKKTLVVKTGSGGFHLYFKLPEGVKYTELSQKSLTGGLDIRTHLGYVIAAGTNGYTSINNVEPMELPTGFIDDMRRKATQKAASFEPERALPLKDLRAVLRKIDVSHYDTNDSWQEIVTSMIATCGNDPEVLDSIEEWSKTDKDYENDASIRTRLETFEPDGGITAGTFLYLLKIEGISKYLYNKIRMLIGKEFTFSKGLSERFDLPFNVDYTVIREEKELMESFYYKKHQLFGADLFAKLVQGNLYYVENEKTYYYFNGVNWIEAPGIQNILFIAFLRAGLVFFTDFSDGKEEDADESLNEYVNFLGSISIFQKFEQNLKQHELINIASIPWDGPELANTLTLKDCVMDYTEDYVKFRPAQREEFRRFVVDVYEKDLDTTMQPVKFKGFLKDIFPNPETRKTATYALATMLSGSGKFRKFQIWNGSGNNGKSALIGIMTKLIGEERAVTYTPDSILSSDKVSPLTPELAQLRGSLVAFSSETNESKKVSEGAIKRLTGDEPIKANPKFKKPVQFHTTWQMVLATNHLPEFSTYDTAFINRLLIIPFHTHFYEDEQMRMQAEKKGSRYFKSAGDLTGLKKEIYSERGAILHYLAQRLLDLTNKIPESGECLEAKKRYIKDNNGISEMIEEMLEYDTTKGYFTPTRDIVNYYNEDQHTKRSSKAIINRIKEVYPFADSATKSINGKLTRGLKDIRLKYGAYPDGYMGNFTDAEIEAYLRAEQPKVGGF